MKTLSLTFSLLLIVFTSLNCDKDDGPTGTGTLKTCGNKIWYVNKSYNTVQIGSQCWLKENLDVGTRINGSQNQTNNRKIEKYCYNDDPSNCDIYGGLYQWDETMQYTNTPGARGICPPGWHIPTESEIYKLRTTIGNDGNALKAVGQGTGEGSGTNTSGFSALLAGLHSSNGYKYIDSLAAFWSSTQVLAYVDLIYLVGDWNNIPAGISEKSLDFSVRCLKD